MEKNPNISSPSSPAQGRSVIELNQSRRIDYLFDTEQLDERTVLRSASPRFLEFGGRRGLNITDIRGRLALPEHTANADQGAVSIWVSSLHDLYPAAPQPGHSISNPYFQHYNLISDCEAFREFTSACFLIGYCTDWHPVFIGKFFRGNVSEGYYRPDGPHAQATANYFFFRRLRWMQIVFTWDKPACLYRIYANGVLIGVEDFGQKNLKAHPIAPTLFIGNPNWVYHRVGFFDTCPTQNEIRALYNHEQIAEDKELHDELVSIYEKPPVRLLEWKADPDWKETLAVDFKNPKDLAEFIVQGRGESVALCSEGLEIHTEPHSSDYARMHAGALSDTHKHVDADFRQIYLWSKDVFEGDIHMTFDFKLKQADGLALIMLQASGMNGEDFLSDYFPRSSSSMKTVCWEDVRNYHWEFYREMKDTRHDIMSHALLKNPWFRSLGFQCVPDRWQLETWYKLSFLQTGERLQAAIDDRIVLDVKDSACDNNGPILRQGRLAIRCMVNTHIVLRNLRVHNRPDYKTYPLSMAQHHYCPNISPTATTGCRSRHLCLSDPLSERPAIAAFFRKRTHLKSVELCRASGRFAAFSL